MEQVKQKNEQIFQLDKKLHTLHFEFPNRSFVILVDVASQNKKNEQMIFQLELQNVEKVDQLYLQMHRQP